MVNLYELPDADCPSCCETLNSEDRKPHLWKCGHHTCDTCITGLQQSLDNAFCMFCEYEQSKKKLEEKKFSANLVSLSQLLKDFNAFQTNHTGMFSEQIEFKK